LRIRKSGARENEKARVGIRNALAVSFVWKGLRERIRNEIGLCRGDRPAAQWGRFRPTTEGHTGKMWGTIAEVPINESTLTLTRNYTN